MGLSIVIYLFLGGTGAGACLVAACLGISALRLAFRGSFANPNKSAISHPAAERARCNGRRLLAESLYAARKTLTASFMAAAFCLAAGACFLLVDLGRPDRALSLLTHPAPSYVAVGAWALGICLCLALLLAFAWKRHATLPPALGFALHGITAIASAVAMAYTGLLLASIMATPLWNSPWLAPLFFLSAASCGCAVVLLWRPRPALIPHAPARHARAATCRRRYHRAGSRRNRSVRGVRHRFRRACCPCRTKSGRTTACKPFAIRTGTTCRCADCKPPAFGAAMCYAASSRRWRWNSPPAEARTWNPRLPPCAQSARSWAALL